MTEVLRKRGRPREFDGIVSIRLPSDLHDALIIESMSRDVDLSDVIREALFIFVSQIKQHEKSLTH